MAKIATLRKYWGDYCHICGYKIDFSAKVGGSNPASATRDHIIPKHLIKMKLSDGKGQVIRLAHSLCNSARGIGGSEDVLTNPKVMAFLTVMKANGVARDPDYQGPVDHNIEIPEQLASKSYAFFFVLLGIQFDFKWVSGRYWHFKIGAKTLDLVTLAGKKGR